MLAISVNADQSRQKKTKKRQKKGKERGSGC
jgi:hypothetical protein